MLNRKPRVLVLIVAYNAEKTISGIVRRIPAELEHFYEVEILIIDDASQDLTFAKSHEASKGGDSAFPVRVIFNPLSRGYGGNQKLGFQYAIEKGFDLVALLHGDGQYAPESLPDLLDPLRKGEADALLGSRMLKSRSALRGRMPLYKFLGNKILTWIQNKLLHAHLSEFHSGYRIYSVEALRAIPFERNSNGFHFDTEITIQLLIAGRKIEELPIPTYYGSEIRHVKGLAYAVNVLGATLKARLQEMSLFYDRRFDCAPPETYSPYTLKLNYTSPHTMTRDRVRLGQRVLDLGCAGGYMGSVLRETKHCSVTGVDVTPPQRGTVDEFWIHDLNLGVPRIRAQDYDVVLMLDVIEHLNKPEAFLEELRQALALNTSIEMIISTGNVGCFITRIMLLAGQFNYGKRGILDATHTRLFTFGSLRRALRQAGFDILETKGVPAPFPLATGDNWIGRTLLALNQCLIPIARGLFAYQIFMRVKPQPSVQSLLRIAEEQSRAKARVLETDEWTLHDASASDRPRL
ncbi:MAG: glycosyltransferase [Acidobacteriaceae bacterium]|nr:glycosyltransferase [Acidobacteriaceae bacterium]MBV9763717.1 glycosyltransferase [Acidobacteriaceae bacterium]